MAKSTKKIKGELMAAVNAGEIGKVQDLLKDPGVLEAFKSLCQAPDSEVLDEPCKQGNEQLVKILLDHGAKLNAKNEMQVMTSLVTNEQRNNITSLLIKYHEDWETFASKIMDTAIESKNRELAVEIIDLDTGFLSYDQKLRALQVAIDSYCQHYDDIDYPKILVDKFMALNQMDDRMIDLIFFDLVENDCKGAFETILKTTENWKSLVKKALHIASKHSCGTDIVFMLLKLGLFSSDDMYKVFKLALADRQDEILKFLMDQGPVFDYVMQSAALPPEVKIPDDTSITKCIKMFKDLSPKLGIYSGCEDAYPVLRSFMCFLIETCKPEVTKDVLSQSYLNAHKVCFPAIATSSLDYAIVNRQMELFQLLIDYENRTQFLTADNELYLLKDAVSINSSYPLIIKLLLNRNVVYLKQSDVKYILEHGQFNEITDSQGIADYEIDKALLQQLLDYVCDMDQTESIDTMSSIDKVFDSFTPNHLFLTDMLLSYGADINSKHEDYLFKIDRYAEDRYSREVADGVVAKYFVKHVVDELAEGRLIKQEHLQKIESIEVLRDYKKQCEEEMETIKIQTFTGTSVSLFEVWKYNLNQRSAYLRNKNIANTLTPDKLREDFPIYADRIILRLNRAFERKLRLGRVCNFFKSLSTRKEHPLPNLPATCVHQIFSHLRNVDLYKLRVAYYN